MQGALEWLEANQDKSYEDIIATTVTPTHADDDPDAEPLPLQPGEIAQSLLCNDCGKKFRSQAQAEFHASKTQHVDFAESTEEVAPLTEEEKKAKLEDLRRKLAEKRTGMSEQDQVDKKRNEARVIRSSEHGRLLTLDRKSDGRAQSSLRTSKKNSRRKSSSKKLRLNEKTSRMNWKRKHGSRPR